MAFTLWILFFLILYIADALDKQVINEPQK